MSQSVVSFVTPTWAQIEFIAENVRGEDAAEIYESSKRDVAEALHVSNKRSDRVAVITVDAKPVAILGVKRLTLLSKIGVPWMIGTDDVRKYAKHLLPHTGRIVGIMMQSHDVLRNMVHDENKSAIRWLKKAGFRMSEPVEYGWRKSKFRMFELTKDEIHV